MTPKTILHTTLSLAAALVISGCATTDSSTKPASATPPPQAQAPAPAAPAPAPAAASTPAAAPSGTLSARYIALDGRHIDIGHAKPDAGGLRFAEPHMEKGKCWLAAGFNFKGFSTLYIAPIVPNTKIHDDEKPIQDIAIKNLIVEIQRSFGEKKFFHKVTTVETPGKTLKLDMTITQYGKGGGAARYFAGLYGAGQPVLRVHGVMTFEGKTLFDFEMRRSGASANGRLAGGVMRDEDVQLGDIRSMVLDLTDFIAAVSGKYTPEN